MSFADLLNILVEHLQLVDSWLDLLDSTNNKRLTGQKLLSLDLYNMVTRMLHLLHMLSKIEEDI